MPVELIDGASKIRRSGVDGGLVPQLAQKAEEDPRRAGDQLALQRGQDAALEDVPRLGGAEDLLMGEHAALPGQRPPQNKVGGDVIVVAGLHHKAQSRFPHAVFIVAQQRLGDPQIPGGSPL